jgi:large subunit ribosomal protein L16
VIKPGRIMFEMEGVDDATAKAAMKLAADKIGIRTRYVARHEGKVAAS